MTIVTMHRSVVAVDSRSRSLKTNAVQHVSQKIVDLKPRKVYWEKERLLVAARCGNTIVTNAIIRGLEAGASIDLLKLLLTQDALKEKFGTRQGKVLVRSAKNAWLVNVHDEVVDIHPLPVNRPFAMGSGKTVACFLMASLEYSAALAAAAIAQTNPNCGGVVNQYRVAQQRFGRPLAVDTKPKHYLHKGVEYSERRLERHKNSRTPSPS